MSIGAVAMNVVPWLFVAARAFQMFLDWREGRWT